MKIIRNILLAFFVVACLAYINVIIPKPQPVEASWLVGQQHYACGSNLTVLLTPGADTACNTSNGYTSTMKITAKDGSQGAYAVHWKWASFWCGTDPHGPCLQHEVDQSGVDGLTGNNTANVTAVTNPSKPNGDFSGQACGFYQNDFAFYVTDNNNPDQVICGISLSNPGQTNNNASWCHADSACTTPNHHLGCQNNACVSIPGGGSDTCTTEPNSCAPQQHLGCQNNACVMVAGAGDATCTTEPNSCAPQTHLTCSNNTCTKVAGPGNDSCTPEGSSCGETPHHNECQNQACVRVDGEGHNSCRLDSSDCQTPHLIVKKVVNNNHGGTKSASDFSLHVKNGDGDVSGSPAAGSTTGTTYTINAGDYVVSEDAVDGYHQVSISGDCDASGHVSLINGTTKTCIIQNEDNGTNECTMPTCNTTVSGCSYPYPDTKTCSCGPLVCITQTPCTGDNCGTTINITNTNTQSQNQQQQQQQAVLGASVAPAVTTSKLPATGTGAEVLLSLFGLLPIGFKLRKFV